jgi:hypothetical protein
MESYITGGESIREVSVTLLPRHVEWLIANATGLPPEPTNDQLASRLTRALDVIVTDDDNENSP